MSDCKCVFDIQNIMSTICSLSEISSIVSLFTSHPAPWHTWRIFFIYIKNDFSLNPLKSRTIFLLQNFFHQGFLISPDAMDSPGTKSSGKIVSRYLDQIVGWELESLNGFKKSKSNTIHDFFCSYRYPNSPFEWFALQVLPQALPTRHIPKVAEVRPNPVVVVLLVLVHPNLIIMLR